MEGIPCYLSKPTQSNGAAIILGSDVFGYKLINARLIADVFADAGYTVAVPDYFKGDSMDVAILETAESLPSRNIFSKIGAVLWLLTKLAGMVRSRASRCSSQDAAATTQDRWATDLVTQQHQPVAISHPTVMTNLQETFLQHLSFSACCQQQAEIQLVSTHLRPDVLLHPPACSAPSSSATPTPMWRRWLPRWRPGCAASMEPPKWDCRGEGSSRGLGLVQG